MPGRLAGSGVGLYIAESPKQGNKMFNSISKTIHFAHLVILYIYVYSVEGAEESMRGGQRVKNGSSNGGRAPVGVVE